MRRALYERKGYQDWLKHMSLGDEFAILRMKYHSSEIAMILIKHKIAPRDSRVIYADIYRTSCCPDCFGVTFLVP